MNAAQCHTCEDVIRSVTRHDFVTCKCGGISVDGGESYNRRLFQTVGTWTELTTHEEYMTALQNTQIKSVED